MDRFLHDIENKINKVEDSRKRLLAVNVLLLCTKHFDEKDFEEHLALYGIDNSWDYYSYLIDKVLFRMRGSFDSLYDLLIYIAQFDNLTFEDGLTIFIGSNFYKLFYDCEDMIIAFQRLYDDKCVNEVTRYFPSQEFKNMFINNIPRYNDIDGLYWRIYLLRNRMAHSTGGKYLNTDDNSCRFLDFSSKANNIRFNNGIPCIECNLIDIEKDLNIKKFIIDLKIERIYGEEFAKKDVFSLLFRDNSPKGKGKDTPYLIYGNFGKFDYYSGLFSLANQILEFIDKQMLVFMRSVINKISRSDFEKIKYLYDNEEIQLKDLFDYDKKEWIKF